jgi:pimeloyl-ACP methyl ester carboxylesterase
MRIVLLHSPLLGPLTWRAVLAELEAVGHTAETPAWPRFSTVGEAYYAAISGSLAATIDAADRDPAVLVAHSGAGALVAGVISRLRTPVERTVLVDAILPHPGLSWFDTAPADMRAHLRTGAEDRHLPPWDRWWPPGALERLVPDSDLRAELISELEPLPLDYFEEPAPPEELSGPCSYLQLSGAYDDEARVAGRLGWPVVRLPLHHLAMMTQPLAVASALARLAV